MNVDSGKKRTVLKDNSWIRRNPEEDEPVDYDPNPGKAVLSQRKSLDNVDSKPPEANQTPVSSGTSVNSLTKRYGSSQELLNKSSSTNTKSRAVGPSSPTKPPVPAKNPALKTPNSSSFTARVFSGANTSSKPLSPVKRTFGEKLPEYTAPQNTNGLKKSSSNGAPPSTPTPAPSSVTVPSSPAPSATSPSVKSPAATTPVIQPAVKSPTRSESVSVSTLVSTSSTSSSQTVITNTKTSLSTLEETPKPVEKPSADLKLSDVSYSSTRSPSSPAAVTVNTRYSYQTPSAPLDDLADTLLPTRSGSVQSQPVRSQDSLLITDSALASADSGLEQDDQQSGYLYGLWETHRCIREDDSRRSEDQQPHVLLQVCHCDLGRLEAGKSLWVYRERVNCANCYSKIRGNAVLHHRNNTTFKITSNYHVL
ncbi:Sciellin [Labeo rohita]|uniref:Sciellin n=1 Tax=Labeo rohita TaxID=84645 RepID=A0ABQ8MMP0_LABRO|nr:Sciellin [Labeo rohita]